ncbi:hypothetical protein CW696_03070 [ANME-2 cluster archaeon]|nr:hypothetical protein [Methanosarcinales archaeon]RJS72316.1 MAG: hypothetical protein CW696_03070 [ANME-2 cluster archaeon]
MLERSTEIIEIDFDEILYLRGEHGVIGIVKAGTGQWFIETDDSEIVLFTDEDDLFVASGFGTDEQMIEGVRCMLYLVREIGSPLIALPRNHPASGRLRIVVSAGERTTIDCKIKPGTHPEQDVLCGMEEFDGMRITGVRGGVQLQNIDLGKIDIRRSRI